MYSERVRKGLERFQRRLQIPDDFRSDLVERRQAVALEPKTAGRYLRQAAE